MENSEITQASTPNRKPTIVLIILVVILAGALGLLYMQYSKMKADNAVAQEALEDQKQSLTNELKDMMGEYEGLKTDNDSLNKQIDKQEDRIKSLLAINASNIEKIRKYKEELVTLRTIMRSYVVQIDSLNSKNQKLVSENIDVKTRLDKERKSNEDLSKEKENLSSKVETASVLSAKNIMVTALNKRGKETPRASRTMKLKSCFTIRENSLITAGEKEIIMRITRPDNLVLAGSASDVFDFEGQQIAFSSKRSVTYDNKDVDMCIFYECTGEIIKGNYKIDLFNDGKMIGTGTFFLK